MNSKKVSLVLLFLLALLSSLVVFFDVPGQRTDRREQLVNLGFFQFNQPRSISDVPLVGLNGETRTLTQNNGAWQLLNFGYMFCPDICPVNLRLMAEIKKNWDELNKEPDIDITHVTFDPERDTLDRLKPYLEFYHKDIKGFTGSIENLRRLAQQLNVVFIHEKPDEYGNYLVTHSDSIALINPGGQFVGMFKGPYNTANMLTVLFEVLR